MNNKPDRNGWADTFEYVSVVLTVVAVIASFGGAFGLSLWCAVGALCFLQMEKHARPDQKD